MKSSLILYNNPMTANGIKMSLMFNALNIAPTINNIALHLGEQKSTEFLAINPDGKIPVLVDGKEIISESNVILFYLANKYQSSLWPDKLNAQTQVLKWLHWQSGGFGEAVSVFAHRKVVLPHWGFFGRQDVSVERLDTFHRVMEKFNSALENKTALAGEKISIADISYAGFFIFAKESKMPIDDYLNILRWLANIESISWWQKTKRSLTQLIG